MYRIEIVVPTPDPLCAFQIDAIAGLPLTSVGPQGGYYSQMFNGQMFNGTLQRLFSATHGRRASSLPTYAPRAWSVGGEPGQRFERNLDHDANAPLALL